MKCLIIRVDKEILWFNISMHNVVPMAKGNTLHHLIDELPQSFGLTQVKLCISYVDAVVVLFKNFEQIFFDVFEN